MEETEKIYKQILRLLKKHKDRLNIDVEEINRRAECHLYGLKLKEKYGFNIDPKRIDNLDWYKFRDFITISKYDGERRKISWSDDGRQPKDEELLCISFSTGPYIFGGDYPTKFFQKFFLELKTYEPKYTDSRNNSLYFSMDKAGKVFNDFEGVLKKYYELNNEDIKLRKIEKMKEELAKLETQK